MCFAMCYVIFISGVWGEGDGGGAGTWIRGMGLDKVIWTVDGFVNVRFGLEVGIWCGSVTRMR